jgi:hypothetical protein
MNSSRLLDLKIFLFLFAMGCGLYLLIYYHYIYLNRIEKKYGIEKLPYDTLFSRMLRCATLSYLSFLTSESWFYKRFERLYKNDWYAQEYLKKLPSEVIRTYRSAFFISLLAAASIFLVDLINYMG